MDNRSIELYLFRILSGFYIFSYNEKKYKLIYPDIQIKYEAEIYSEEEHNQNKYNDWLTTESALDVLITLGLWPVTGDLELSKLENQIENLKIDLYKNFINPTKTKSIKKTLNNYKETYNRFYNIRHSLDYVTLEGYCNNLKHEYILRKSLYTIDNKLVFDNNYDTILFNKISDYLIAHSIDIPVFKAIARSNLWKNYWNANKHNLFDRPTINWTDEQKTLVVLTKMYESAYEHPECPSDQVIEDDDMFEGWMLYQRKENEKTKNKNRMEKMLPGKLNKAQEVFLKANSKEEANNIYELNDIQSKGIIKERQDFLNKNKDKNINVTDLPDVKRDFIIQSNEKRKDLMRK